jgi:hypothetical protein
MPPRIRSFLRRPPYARAAKPPAHRVPSVFREFVETLQRLDPPATLKRAEPATPRRRGYGRRRPKQSGNGHARPRGANGRSRPQ